jgi:hypothetical protein
VDVQLRSRALQAVIEELPASAAMSTVARGGLAGLTAFFDGADFAACVLERGSMAEAFGRFAEVDAGPVATVEAAIASARRRIVPTVASGEIVRGRVVAIRAPEGSSQRMEAIRASLGAAPAVTMATPRWRLPSLPPLGDEAIPLLVEARGQRVAVSVSSDALHELLEGLTEPVPLARARALAMEAGADSEAEATEILFDLVEEGLLVVG